MGKIFKAILALVLLSTVSLFAQNKCIELCTSCQDKQDQACQIVENHCSCTALLESIKAIQVDNDTSSTESLNKISSEIADEKQDFFGTANEEKSIEENVIEEASVIKQQDSTITSTKSNDFEANIHEPNSSHPENISKKAKNYYLGFSLASEMACSEDYYGTSLDGFCRGSGLSIGYVFKHYFNRFISLNLGFNAIYLSGEYDIKVKSNYYSFYTKPLDFSTLMAEIPIGFRAGIPLGSFPVSLYLSSNIHIRKPLYQWYEIDLGDDYRDYNSYDGFAAYSDWEFIHLLGFGIEIKRRFSFEMQLYMGNFRIYKDGYNSSAEQGYLNGDSGRFKIEVTF